MWHKFKLVWKNKAERNSILGLTGIAAILIALVMLGGSTFFLAAANGDRFVENILKKPPGWDMLTAVICPSCAAALIIPVALTCWKIRNLHR